ncbi:hypothetical protein H5410_051793 [Solanum commersonii]|uniref:Uncharacterized protein n=1 Tax=Solanum commersonii TaxID=4109 RepID=A0A9J5X1R7_SOLCO|nr:hypothetical protein H5410_051793 [Solanum commersonii]
MAFDLVEDNSIWLQMPSQCVEIDYCGDMHSRKSNVVEDECLETNMDIVFGGSLQRNESEQQGQFANLKLLIAGEISLIPSDDDDEIVESYPCLFNQPYFANFGTLAIESMTDGLPTCYWTCGDHLSATKFDKNGYLPIIGTQGGNVQFFAIMCSCCYNSGNDSKTACKGAFHNWLLDMLVSYVLAIGSGNSKVDQVFDTISNEAWKVSNAMFTLLLVGMLVEPFKETKIVQQLHLTDREQKIDLVAFDEMYVDIIFQKLTITEYLYLDKLLFKNKGGVSKSNIQSYDVRNDVKHEKINDGTMYAECFFPMDDGVNLFTIKLGGMVKVNCVWDPRTMH